MKTIWAMLKDAGQGFLADDCLTRAAAIAYFTLFSVGPLLFIATGIAGLVFGQEQVDKALADQLTAMVGAQSANAVRMMASSALGDARGGWALAIGLATLLLTASGTFGALQSALNAIWKTETPDADTVAETVSRFVRAKAAALGLVAATGFIMIASLAASAAISALGAWLTRAVPGGALVVAALDTAVTVLVLALLFAAIFKLLPDRRLAWRDVAIGAAATAVLFTIGKSAIGFYIGHSNVAAGFGTAGALIILLVWIYYSALIFLAGAEFTRAWANREGSRRASRVPARRQAALPAPRAAWATPRAREGWGVILLSALLPLAIEVIVSAAIRRRRRPRSPPAYGPAPAP